MKRLSYITIILAALSFASCHDWLTESAPGTTDVKDFLSSEEAAIQQTNGVYVPLAWEFNNVFYGEWAIGDVCSDDAIKGGESIQNAPEIYDLSNFQTTSNNSYLLDFYRAQYQGIERANIAIEMIGGMSSDFIGDRMRSRLIAEAKFLRAYYYFRLVRIFGGVPLVIEPIYSSADWKQPRATTEAVYERIITDLKDAEADLWFKSDYPASDLGRATKGAAQAMLLKTCLYAHKYEDAYTWGTKFMTEQSGEYDLQQNFLENFAIEGENGIESVFEVQYVEEGTSDWGGNIPNGANGSTRGNMSTKWMRPRNANICITDFNTMTGDDGYGFDKPTEDLRAAFENGDPRREWTIYEMSDDEISSPAQEIQYGNRNINRKYLGFYSDGGKYNRYYKLDHATRSPINRREIRLADVLLLYAEACLESGHDLDKGKFALNRVRGRVGLGEVELTEQTLRHERRVELAMEGHRWFDLCRWGIAGDTMNAYRQKYIGADGADMREFVKGKHELFPIPWEEVRLSGLSQNAGY